MDYIGLERIKALQAIREEISQLQAVERSLLRPLLSSYKDIPKVLDAFMTVTGTKSTAGTWMAVESRKKFIFIAIFIFAPGMILGDNMPKCLRAELGKALGIKAASAISNNWTDALFYYHQYSEFRSEIKRITSAILVALGIEPQSKSMAN